MIIRDFLLEKYFAKYEFTADYMFSCSDCDGYSMEYIINQADDYELRLWNELRLGYTEVQGSPFLRQAISKYYKGSSIDDIVVASPGELSFMTMNILTEGVERPHAVVVSPSYQSLYQVLESLNCDISFWEAEEREQQWKFDIDKLRSLVRPETRLIVINFPHNPTGAYLNLAELQEVIDIARSCNAYIYSDEMYRDLIIGETEALPPIYELYDKGISLWGMAKSFGLAGARIGWLVAKDKDFIDKVLTFKHYLSMCNSAPSEILSAIVLNHPEAFLQPNIEKIRKNISLFSEAVEQKRLSWVEKFIHPLAGSVAFVKIKTDVDAAVFSERLVKEKNILTVPSELFEFKNNYLRIGFGRENFAEVLKMMEFFC